MLPHPRPRSHCGGRGEWRCAGGIAEEAAGLAAGVIGAGAGGEDQGEGEEAAQEGFHWAIFVMNPNDGNILAVEPAGTVRRESRRQDATDVAPAGMSSTKPVPIAG